MQRRLSRNRSSDWPQENEGVNPIEGIANLADAMLIFSVGAMLALIVNWHVDINQADASSSSQTGKNSAVTFTQKDLTPVEGKENPDSAAMKKLGTVYYDEKTNTYYILGADGSTTASASPDTAGTASPNTSPTGSK